MTWHVFVTTPRAGVPFAVSPYTVECKEVFATRAEAEAFAAAGTLSTGVVALLDAMPSVHPPWAPDQDVVIGTLRSYESNTVRCIQGHRTQSDWAPPLVPTLWVTVPLPGASAWSGAAVVYALPSQRTHGGRLYELLIPHTSQAAWAPPNVPALWRDIGPAEGTAAYTRAQWQVVSSDEPDYVNVERAKEPA